jgi:hypothetical protein
MVMRLEVEAQVVVVHAVVGDDDRGGVERTEAPLRPARRPAAGAALGSVQIFSSAAMAAEAPCRHRPGRGRR